MVGTIFQFSRIGRMRSRVQDVRKLVGGALEQLEAEREEVAAQLLRLNWMLEEKILKDKS